jgi:SAM-dependent methyltransferase
MRAEAHTQPNETSLPEARRFNAEDRPTEVRSAPRWSRLSYIVRALPAGLEELAPELRVPEGGRVLDFGCADAPYRRFFGPDVDYVPADLPGNEHARLHVNPDGTLPLPDECFDAVLSTQVLEHVDDPATYLAECARVLKPGGRALISTHGVMVWHPDPVDYWRWTCSGLARVVEDAGLEVVRFEGIMGLAATGLQLFQDAVVYSLPRPLRKPFAFVMQTLIGLADRVQGAESRRYNALVFALVAERPRR